MPIYQDNRQYKQRLKWLRYAIVVGIAVLGAKLWYLGVVQFEHFSMLAERNRVRLVPLIAPRGFIVDREGRILVENSNGFDLIYDRHRDDSVGGTLEFVASGLDVTVKEMRERIQEARMAGTYEPLVLAEKLGLDEISFILAHGSEHPELRVASRPKRMYRHGDLAAHTLGYVGEASLTELKSEEFAGVRPGDIVGKFGLERTYNARLTGEDGYQKVLVDSLGRNLEVLQTQPPKQGGELQVTLDLDLQLAAEEALDEKSGAIVATDPHTGEILAMVSHPAFDPNDFAGRMSRADWEELVGDPDHPLQNRVIQSRFSPGSIFKVVMALAGLESGVGKLDDHVYCPGSILMYGRPFRCWSWETGGHGSVDLVAALQHSCNVYFYLLGQKLGIDRIAEFSRRVGLGKVTGIDLKGEVAGLVPSPEWKRESLNQPWYAGETISVSIGQGAMVVTPIQLAQAMGMMATGRAVQLHMVASGEKTSSPGRALNIAPEHLEAVREGLWRGVNQWGTGKGAKVDGLDVCGKTGSVQTISRETKERLSEEEAEQFTANAWFVGFAPRDDPRLVVAVMVERGGSGGQSAAPVAGKVFQAFYDKQARNGQIVQLREPAKTDDGWEPEPPARGGND